MGDIEISKCDFCGKSKQVQRVYIRSSITNKPTIIYYCRDCGEPVLYDKKALELLNDCHISMSLANPNIQEQQDLMDKITNFLNTIDNE